MMYHFMFGLRGGSLVTATPSVPGACSTPAAASFFSSSCMIKFKLRPARSGLLPKIAIQKCDAPLDHIVRNEKEDAKDEYCNHHNRGGGAYFFPRWRGDLAHLGTHVVVKRLGPIRPGSQPVSEIVTVACD